MIISFKTRYRDTEKAAMTKKSLLYHTGRPKKLAAFPSLICRRSTKYCITRGNKRSKSRSHPKRRYLGQISAATTITRWTQLPSNSNSKYMTSPNWRPTQRHTSSRWNSTHSILAAGLPSHSYYWPQSRTLSFPLKGIVYTGWQQRPAKWLGRRCRGLRIPIMQSTKRSGRIILRRTACWCSIPRWNANRILHFIRCRTKIPTTLAVSQNRLN